MGAATQCASRDLLEPVIGPAAARELMDAFAGRRLHIPRAPGAHHPITAAIGPEAAAQLAEAFHGTAIEFPVSSAKRRRVLELARQGLTNGRIAREVWLTERRVRQIRSGARGLPEPPQPQHALPL
jgi:DNA-binding NarL/FixJ family response regulator